MPNTPSLERLLARTEAVLARFEASLPPLQQAPDWQSAVAFRWRKSNDFSSYRATLSHEADFKRFGNSLTNTQILSTNGKPLTAQPGRDR